MIATTNLFEPLPDARAAERFEPLLRRPGLLVERIVSHGQATPSGLWYDQGWDEWVLLLAGSAELLIEGENAPRNLQPGDSLLLPAGCRHRVTWTTPHLPTVWLALHYGDLPEAETPHKEPSDA